MAQLIALARLLGGLMRAELRSASSAGLNNLFFCVLFLLAGNNSPGQVRAAFWSTLIFQLVLLLPLLVVFSVDTFNRLPAERMALLPLSRGRRMLLSSISLVANPLFALLLIVYGVWVGPATATGLLLVALVVHAGVAVVRSVRVPVHASFSLRLPGRMTGIAVVHLLDMVRTLDLWAAVLIALAGCVYRLSGAAQRDALPILAMITAVAMSTLAQRNLSLDEGRAAMRFRLLPLAGWRLLLVLDLMWLGVIALLTAPLDPAAGLAFSLVASAAGRYPALSQAAPQRRGRFISGDARFGASQIVAGVLAGLGAARTGPAVLLGAGVVYAGSLLWGGRAWDRSARAKRF